MTVCGLTPSGVNQALGIPAFPPGFGGTPAAGGAIAAATAAPSQAKAATAAMRNPADTPSTTAGAGDMGLLTPAFANGSPAWKALTGM